MIKATKVAGGWYEVLFVHPTTEESVMQADGFKTIEEVSTFAADIASAVTSTYVSPTDMQSQVEELAEEVPNES